MRKTKNQEGKTNAPIRNNNKKKGHTYKSNKYSRSRDRDYGKAENVTNDPAWYGGNQLAKSSANIFFTKPFGYTMKLWDDATWETTATSGYSQFEFSAAGAMVLTLHPAFGPSFGSNDVAPLNITSQAIFSFVRHANSGSRNYDAPDLMTYLLAMSEVYSAITWLQRLYATVNRYYPTNRYWARGMVTAMGVDFDDLLGNMAQFNYYINLIISKATAFAIPNNMPFFTRRASVYSNIYAEDESIKDQMYLFNPAGFYKYTVDNTYPEAYLKYERLAVSVSTPITFSRIQTYVNDMLQRLLESEDIGIMSGDIIKAYGNNILKLAPLETNVLIDPVIHDYNVLFQIRNATIVPNYIAPDVHQDSAKQYLEWNASINFSSEIAAARYYHKEILTSNSTDPTADEVLESTRLMTTIVNYENQDAIWIGALACGIEVVTSIRMFRFGNNSGSNPSLSVNNIAAPFLTTDLATISYLSNFKYHPTLFFYTTGASGAITSFSGVYQDLDNVALIDQDTLMNLHQTAIMNMLAVPAIAML